MPAETQTTMATADRPTPARVLILEARRASLVSRRVSSGWPSPPSPDLLRVRLGFLRVEALMLFFASRLMRWRSAQCAMKAKMIMRPMRMGRSISQS